MKPRAAAKCGRRRREKLKCHPAVGRKTNEKNTGGEKNSEEGERPQHSRRARGHGSTSRASGRIAGKIPLLLTPSHPLIHPRLPIDSRRHSWLASESARQTSGDTSEPRRRRHLDRRLRCPHFTSRRCHGNLPEWVVGGKENANRAAEVLGDVLLYFSQLEFKF